MQPDNKKEFYTTTELSSILGLSRSQVFRKVKSGKIPAQKAGRVYLISKSYVLSLPQYHPDQKDKEVVKAVKKVLSQYGEVIKDLGQE